MAHALEGIFAAGSGQTPDGSHAPLVLIIHATGTGSVACETTE